MNWPLFAGSLAAIFLLAGAAWALRLGRDDSRIRSPEAAAEAAEHALADFVAENAVVGTDERGALVVGGGRVAVVKAHGARLAVREVAWRAVRSCPGGVVVETGEWRFGAVALRGVDSLHVRRLSPQLTRV